MYCFSIFYLEQYVFREINQPSYSAMDNTSMTDNTNSNTTLSQNDYIAASISEPNCEVMDETDENIVCETEAPAVKKLVSVTTMTDTPNTYEFNFNTHLHEIQAFFK